MEETEIRTRHIQAKYPRLGKVWFYLTCWRPITKYEYNKLAQAVITLYNNEVRARIEKENEIIVYMQGLTMAQSMKEDEGDEMYA